MAQSTAPHISPLDPDSDAGRAAADALTDVLATIEVAVAGRKRATAKRRSRRTDKAA